MVIFTPKKSFLTLFSLFLTFTSFSINGKIDHVWFLPVGGPRDSLVAVNFSRFWGVFS
jgi:hypothetical protein